VIKLILNSRTYQLAAVPNESNARDDQFFSHFMPKAMPAQAMLDMLNQATGSKEQFGSFPEANQSRTIGNAHRKRISGRLRTVTSRFSGGHRPENSKPNLVQTLMMINSPYVRQQGANRQYDRRSARPTPRLTKTWLRTFTCAHSIGCPRPWSWVKPYRSSNRRKTVARAPRISCGRL